MERNIVELNKRNIPYIIVPNPKTLTEIGKSLLVVGEATNTTERAKLLYEKYNLLLENYLSLSKNVENPKRIYWEWWAKPIFTPGATNWLTEISQLAGGENIFQDMPQANVQTDWEEVQKRNPDVICIIWVGVHKKKVNPKVILKRPNSMKMAAINNNQMYILEEELFCRPSPRLLIGLNKIASILHPAVFPPFSENRDPLLTEKLR
jgi:iron complex transport system substrate-binding protein